MKEEQRAVGRAAVIGVHLGYIIYDFYQIDLLNFG